MGTGLLDQYSFLHFAVGIIAYFWGFSFIQTIIIHTIFESIENTLLGINFINTYFKGFWPGGKPIADTLINSIGDTISVMIGWLMAYYLDQLGIRYGLYEPHLTKN